MSYLGIELSGRTMMLLGGLSMIIIILIAIWGAKRYNNKKQR
jgi:amino acid transporter